MLVNPLLRKVKLETGPFILWFLIGRLNPTLRTLCKTHLGQKEHKIFLLGGLLQLFLKNK